MAHAPAQADKAVAANREEAHDSKAVPRPGNGGHRSLVVAVAVYSSSVPWSHATQSGAPLFATLRGPPPHIARIEIKQGSNMLTLVRNGDDWRLKEHESFPQLRKRCAPFW